jgi:hypothetical protein
MELILEEVTPIDTMEKFGTDDWSTIPVDDIIEYAKSQPFKIPLIRQCVREFMLVRETPETNSAIMHWRLFPSEITTRLVSD